MGTNYQKLHEKEYQDIIKRLDNVLSDNKIIKDTIVSERKKFTKEINLLKKENKKLTKEVARLKNQINKDSSNSGKPPSSNGFKKVVQNNREKSNKKPGGQMGHKGSTLEPVKKPDVVIEHKKEKCDCGHILENTVSKSKQEINLKLITEVTEHIFYDGFCPSCKKTHTIKIPACLNNPISYGTSIKSIITLLSNQGIVSINRSGEFLKLITNGLVNVSDGTIYNWNKELSGKLEPVIGDIKQNLLNSETLNTDESPIKVNGKQMYIHNASTDKYTLQVPHKKRGIIAIEDIGLLSDYCGTIISDHYKAYYRYGSANAECNVHIARYLKNIIEITEHKWAKDFLDFLYNIKKSKEEKINSNIDFFIDEEIDDIYGKYDEIIQLGKSEYKLANHKEDDERKLLKRLEEYKENHLMFVENFKVPFSNNLAERDLRGAKTKQKIGKFRSLEGATIFCTIRSVELTLKKNNINFFGAISDAFNNNPILI